MRSEIIGNCTLYLADCLEILPTIKADAVITDPPYNFSTSANGSKHDLLSDMNNTAYFFKEVIRLCLNTLPLTGGTYWQFLNWKTLGTLQKAVFDLDKTITSIVVWDKKVLGPSYPGLRPSYEMIMLLLTGEAKIENRHLNDIWEYPFRIGNTRDHPAEKPIALMNRLVSETAGTVILDPFMGSGTTGVAAINYNKRFVGIELNEKWFDVACKRIDRHLKEGRLEGIC